MLDGSTDASAEIARAIVAEVRRRAHDVTLIQRSYRASLKAEALTAGLARPSQPFAAVFEADYVRLLTSRDCVFGVARVIRVSPLFKPDATF